MTDHWTGERDRIFIQCLKTSKHPLTGGNTDGKCPEQLTFGFFIFRSPGRQSNSVVISLLSRCYNIFSVVSISRSCLWETRICFEKQLDYSFSSTNWILIGIQQIIKLIFVYKIETNASNCHKDYIFMCSVHFFSEMQTSVNEWQSERVHADNIPAWTTPEKCCDYPCGNWLILGEHHLPRSREIRRFVLSFSSVVTLQLTGPAPSWHPGGIGSPASLWEKGGEREGWEGREEEGMNQNTIKGTEWPLWELKACWLEAALGRLGRDGRRQAHTERESGRSPFKPDPDIVPLQWPLIMPGLLVYTGLNKPA